MKVLLSFLLACAPYLSSPAPALFAFSMPVRPLHGPGIFQHSGTDNEASRGQRKTKNVHGKRLTSDNFAYVGDENDVSTWKLPIHDASHVRNALARFNQTKGIPEDRKEEVWNRIVAAAGKFGIKVSTSSRPRTPPPK